MDFELQLGGKGGSPRELTQVSDRGERPQPTTLQLERRRVIAKALPGAAYARLFSVLPPY
ncbi:hypothetical protein D4100_07470 [Serratia inhibens]|uniref:Uncharacterized protein n=1 Tax=Serratia inhibens TaxID=2338073 RepID=A0AA92X7W4_9GAMM|nr:hypothetical protein D4100_07470 [Serratia inhibens]